MQYLLVIDALNFCFWPQPGLEYEHLARGIKVLAIHTMLKTFNDSMTKLHAAFLTIPASALIGGRLHLVHLANMVVACTCARCVDTAYIVLATTGVCPGR